MKTINKATKRAIKPVNQKSLYFAFADLYEKIMNHEIEIDKADQANKALSGMNSVYGNELKRAKLENKSVRVIELKNFEDDNDLLLGRPYK